MQPPDTSIIQIAMEAVLNKPEGREGGEEEEEPWVLDSVSVIYQVLNRLSFRKARAGGL